MLSEEVILHDSKHIALKVTPLSHTLPREKCVAQKVIFLLGEFSVVFNDLIFFYILTNVFITNETIVSIPYK